MRFRNSIGTGPNNVQFLLSGKEGFNHRSTGFKGSWLTLWLRELGAEVIGISLDPLTKEDFFVRTKLQQKVTDHRGDINNLKGLIEIFKKYEPDFVFHLAAQPIVRVSYDNPIETFQTNIMGNVNILEAI